MTDTLKTEHYIISGIAFGDEGKGKGTDSLCNESVAKYGKGNVVCTGINGGSNAGHTTCVKREDGTTQTFYTNFYPTGVLTEGVINYTGNNKFLNLVSLRKETVRLNQDIPGFYKNVYISEGTHVTFIGHSIKDIGVVSQKIGTTGQGIGPTGASRMYRYGLRLAQVRRMSDEELKEKIINMYKELGLESYSKTETLYTYTQWNDDGTFFEVNVDYDTLFSCVKDIENIRWFLSTFEGRIVNTLWFKDFMNGRDTQTIYIHEMSNAVFLDPTFGTYPNVTVTGCIPTTICESLGLNFTDISKMSIHVIGIVKAYMTRVGSGSLPSVMKDENVCDKIIVGGGEFGVTTGRRRTPGWLDLVALRLSVKISGVTELTITRMDNLSQFDKIDVCIGYTNSETTISVYDDHITPFTTEEEFSKYQPVYITIDGWKDFDFTKVKCFDDLHENAKEYIRLIEDVLDVNVTIVNTGKHRDEYIKRVF